MSEFAQRDGDRVAVLRPDDSRKALKSARKIMRLEEDGKISRDEAEVRFNGILSEQRYTFVGLLGPDQEVLDHDGSVVGRLRPGDSFAPYSQVLAVHQASLKGAASPTESAADRPQSDDDPEPEDASGSRPS